MAWFPSMKQRSNWALFVVASKRSCHRASCRRSGSGSSGWCRSAPFAGTSTRACGGRAARSRKRKHGARSPTSGVLYRRPVLNWTYCGGAYAHVHSTVICMCIRVLWSRCALVRMSFSQDATPQSSLELQWMRAR